MLNILKVIKLEPTYPLIQSVRHKQIFTRRPRAPHFWAQNIAKVVAPIYPKPFDHDFPQHLKCRKILAKIAEGKHSTEENPYERILANEIKDAVMKSRMILVFHMNPVLGHFFHKSRVAFKKEGMILFRNSKFTFRMALEDTKYASVLRLFESYTLMVSCEEPKVHAAYKLLKKMPYYVVLAGFVDGKFVNRLTLDEYGKLPDINAARAQIANTLTTPAALLAHNISLYGESLDSDSK